MPTFDSSNDSAVIRRRQYAAMQVYWQRVLGLQAAGKLETEQGMDALDQLANLAIQLELYQAANDLLHDIYLWSIRHGSSFQTAYVQIKRAHLALEMENIAEANRLLNTLSYTVGAIRSIDSSDSDLECFESTVEWEGADALQRRGLLSSLYLVVGSLFLAGGHYATALIRFQRGIKHATAEQTDALRFVSAPLQLALIQAKMELGDLDEAIVALRIFESELVDPARQEWQIRSHEYWAKIMILRGRYGDALHHIEKSGRLCRQLGALHAVRVTALNEAHLRMIVNQTARAELLIDAVIDEARRAGDQVILGRATYLKALSAQRTRSWAAEIPFFASLTDLRRNQRPPGPASISPAGKRFFNYGEAPRSFLTWFEIKALPFYWSLVRSDRAAAQIAHAEMHKWFDQTDSQLVRARLSLLDCVLALCDGLTEDALEGLSAIYPQFERMGLLPEMWQIRRLQLHCMRALDRPLADCRVMNRTANRLLQQLAASLPVADRPTFFLNKWSAYEESLTIHVQQLMALRRMIGVRRWWQRPLLHLRLWNGIETLLHEVDRDRAHLANQVSPHSSQVVKRRLWSCATRMFRHPGNRATLVFVSLPDQLVCVSVGRFRLDFAANPVARPRLNAILENWYAELDKAAVPRHWRDLLPVDRQQAPINTRATHGDQLSAALGLDDLLQSLPATVRGLTIVPDDCLRTLSFAALPYDGGYLVERFALSYSFLTSESSSSQARDGSQVIVGVTCANSDFGALPGVLAETNAVAKSLSGDSVRLNDHEAKKMTVIDQLQRAKLCHIASHGVFYPNDPGRSGVVLIPRKDGKEEVLTLQEIAGLKLSGLQHITLSNCWSADHLVLPGRRAISLPETFWRAGAGSVLASLWEVNDEFGAKLMAEFYGNLTKYPRDEALRQAQLRLLHTVTPSMSAQRIAAPVNWASFVLYGQFERYPF